MEDNTKENGRQKANEPGAQTPPPQQPPQGQYNYGYHYPYYPPPHPPRRSRSDKPKIAGGLLIIAGILGLIMASFMILGGTFMGNMDMFEMADMGQVDINGVVLASDGTPIDNVTLTVEGTHISVMTNMAGEYQMLGVPAGHQELTVEKSGYNTIVRHIYIVPDGTSSLYDQENQFIITDDAELNFNLSVGSDTFTYGDDAEIWATEGIEDILIVIGVIFALCSIAALVGGYYAMYYKKYPLVIIGAILGIFSVGFGIGTILAIAALFTLLLASSDFKDDANAFE